MKFLDKFEELCGKKNLQKVILTTTMCDEVDQETGETTREGELKSTYWDPMLQRNSTMNRFIRTRESAFTVIDPLIDTANIRNSALLRRIRNEIKRGADDETILEPLQDEYQKVKINMESTINEMRKLKIPIGKRFVKMSDNSLVATSHSSFSRWLIN